MWTRAQSWMEHGVFQTKGDRHGHRASWLTRGWVRTRKGERSEWCLWIKKALDLSTHTSLMAYNISTVHVCNQILTFKDTTSDKHVQVKMYTSTHTHTHTHTHIHTHTDTHILTHTHTITHAHTLSYTHLLSPSPHTHTDTHTHPFLLFHEPVG